MEICYKTDLKPVPINQDKGSNGIWRTCLRQLSRFFVYFLLTIPGTSLLQAQDSRLQKRITLADTVCTIETAFKLIEKETGLSFSYNSGLINRKKRVNLRADNEELIVILRRTLENPNLNYDIIGRHIVVYQSVKTLSVNPETQNDSVHFFEIRGRVFDRNDKQPLAYANIFLAGTSIGTVSNDAGQFILKLNSKYLYDTVSISCIGYKNHQEPVSFMAGSERDYLLKPDAISIQEVIIRKISPISLLQSANASIPENYPVKPAILTSFYRESIKKGDRFMMVSEAILENYKSGYRNAYSDQMKIVKGRKSEDIGSGDSVILKLKAGLNTMLLLDVVKNMPDFLTGTSIQDYNYKMADIVVDNGRDNYVIEFSPKERSVSAYYSGRILLDVRDLAFKWVEFFIDPEHLNLATSFFILRKPPDLKAKVLKASYKVSFRKAGSKYYLNLIECETEYKFRQKNQLAGSVYGISLEMAVTDIDTIYTDRFRLKEIARINEFFAEQVGTYDESFWGEYNFISPEESLEDALVKLSKKKNNE